MPNRVYGPAAAAPLVTGPGAHRADQRSAGSCASSSDRRAAYRSRGDNGGSLIPPAAPGDRRSVTASQSQHAELLPSTQRRPPHVGHIDDHALPVSNPPGGGDNTARPPGPDRTTRSRRPGCTRWRPGGNASEVKTPTFVAPGRRRSKDVPLGTDRSEGATAEEKFRMDVITRDRPS